MKPFDENEIAKRLGAPTPPPPPDLATRIKGEIPERVEVPPALGRPPGALPFIRRPLGGRLLALAAILFLGIAANLAVRRMLRPPAAPLEVAFVESAPAPGGAVAAPDAAVTLDQAPPPPEGAAAPSAERPPAGTAAKSAAKGNEVEERREAGGPAPASLQAKAPPAAMPEAAAQPPARAAVAAAEKTEAFGVAGGVEGGVAGGVPGGVPEPAPAQADETGPVYRVGGPVTAPEIIHRVEPEYPEAARRAGLRGVVLIETVIDRDGAVVRPRVVRNTTGSDECAAAALRAVRQWRYRPASLEGRPVASHLALAIEFRPTTTSPPPTDGPPRR